jgi:hypothetical protein
MQRIGRIAVLTNQCLEGIMRSFGTETFVDQAKSAADPMHMCVDRHRWEAKTEEQDARGGFGTDAR